MVYEASRQQGCALAAVCRGEHLVTGHTQNQYLVEEIGHI